MAICKHCEKEMNKVGSCIAIPISVNKVIYKPIPYGEETRVTFTSERCHDCNIERGGYHHPGCDVEECPICHGQIISCECLDEEE